MHAVITKYLNNFTSALLACVCCIAVAIRLCSPMQRSRGRPHRHTYIGERKLLTIAALHLCRSEKYRLLAVELFKLEFLLIIECRLSNLPNCTHEWSVSIPIDVRTTSWKPSGLNKNHKRTNPRKSLSS